MSMTSSAGISLILLVVWAILCAGWNSYGVVQLTGGGQALGPTASIMGAGLAVALAVLLILAFLKWPSAYRWLTLAPLVIASMTIWNAFNLDSSLWPSEFWRWAGIAVNALGVAGSVIAFFAHRRG